MGNTVSVRTKGLDKPFIYFVVGTGSNNQVKVIGHSCCPVNLDQRLWMLSASLSNSKIDKQRSN